MPERTENPLGVFFDKLFQMFDGPVTWFRESVVLPNQKHYPYYHREYRRVPTVDECYENDVVCMHEANEQFKRDMAVDAEVVNILRRRKVECFRYEGHERHERCKDMFDDYSKAELNYFIKYGDLGAYAHVKFCYLKQKHRMVYERRKAEGTWKPIIKEKEGSLLW